MVVLSGMSPAQNQAPLGNLLQLVSVLAGLVLGIVGVLRIVERSAVAVGDSAEVWIPEYAVRA